MAWCCGPDYMSFELGPRTTDSARLPQSDGEHTVCSPRSYSLIVTIRVPSSITASQVAVPLRSSCARTFTPTPHTFAANCNATPTLTLMSCTTTVTSSMTSTTWTFTRPPGPMTIGPWAEVDAA